MTNLSQPHRYRGRPDAGSPGGVFSRDGNGERATDGVSMPCLRRGATTEAIPGSIAVIDGRSDDADTGRSGDLNREEGLRVHLRRYW